MIRATAIGLSVIGRGWMAGGGGYITTGFKELLDKLLYIFHPIS